MSKSRAETCRDEGEEGACAKYGQKGEGREGERTSADKTLGERGEGGEEGRMEFQGLAAPTHTHPSARKVIKERYPRPPPPGRNCGEGEGGGGGVRTWKASNFVCRLPLIAAAAAAATAAAAASSSSLLERGQTEKKDAIKKRTPLTSRFPTLPSIS